MSSKPSPEGVAELLEQLAKLEELGEEIRKIESLLPRLRTAKEEYAQAHRAVTDQLVAMDVTSNSNAGWPARVVWFLAELRRQAATKVEISK